MNSFVKYVVPSLAVISLVGTMCNRPADDKDTKTGKAGDQFDLFAVLNTFKNSSSPESFEKSINSKSTGVNNLDLDEDGATDYIRVTDKKIDESSHALVLQVDVAAGETQDIAVIEIEKTGDKEAHIQIIGDEELYGDDYIVEPKAAEASAGFVVATTLAVNVWTWPAVAFIYSPAYVVWTSPYYYEYYPVWWEPWPVVVYDVYYPAVVVHRTHYAFSDGYRAVHIHEKYHHHHRVTTKFHYREKDHGVKHHVVNVKNDKGGRSHHWKDQDGKSSAPAHSNRVSPGGTKNDAGNNKRVSSPGNDGKKSPGNIDRKDNNSSSSPAKNERKPAGNDGKKEYNSSSSPKQDAHRSPGNQSSSPKQSAPSKHGGKPQGGRPGGKHK